MTNEFDDYVPALLQAAKEMRQGIDRNFAWADLCQGAAEYITSLRDPIAMPSTNQKCPRCGFVTANVFDCPTCKNPMAPFGEQP